VFLAWGVAAEMAAQAQQRAFDDVIRGEGEEGGEGEGGGEPGGVEARRGEGIGEHHGAPVPQIERIAEAADENRDFVG